MTNQELIKAFTREFRGTKMIPEIIFYNTDEVWLRYKFSIPHRIYDLNYISDERQWVLTKYNKQLTPEDFSISYNYAGRNLCNEQMVEVVIHVGYDLKTEEPEYYLNIRKVLFNNPATIVFWNDGTKTVVKRQKGDRYDKEKGLMAAIIKKHLGNKGNYYNEIKKWLED